MLNVTLYEFKKRENSTLRPDSSVTQKTHTAVLKDDTSLLNPKLIFDFGLKGNPCFYNYAYISELGNRYYFIRDWTVGPGHLWTATCEVDVLASWKTSIGQSRQYVTRSSYSYNGNIVDQLYTTKQGVTLTTESVDTPWKTSLKDGYFVIGVTNAQDGGIGAVHYYALTQSQFNELTSYMMSDVNWMSISDITEELQKALINPLQYISTCFWYPTTSIFGSSVSSINIGFWDIAVSAKLINTTARISEYVSIPIPKHPQKARGTYLNGGPFSTYMLMFPGFGEVQLDANELVTLDTLFCKVTLDCITGQGKLYIHDGANGAADGNILQVVRSQVAVPIQLSQGQTDVIGAVSGTVGAIAKIAGGGLKGAISGTMGLLGNAIDAQIPKYSSNGSNGSFAEFENAPTIYASFYPIIEEDNENRGRPLCAVKTLSDLPGYQVIADPDLAIAGTSEENRAIKSYLANGYFYE